MTHYLMHFAVYTLAMIGLIFFALFVYKKFSWDTLSAKRTGCLAIDDVLNLSPRKTMYVIKAGEERFLIASDVDRTTLIAKLDSKSSIQDVKSEMEVVENINE